MVTNHASAAVARPEAAMDVSRAADHAPDARLRPHGLATARPAGDAPPPPRLDPRSLTSHNVIQLQRMIGNRAVTRLVGMQRRPDAGPLAATLTPSPPTIQTMRSTKSYWSKVKARDDQQKDLTAIADSLAAYNAIKTKADPTFQQRLVALGALDRLLYGWFDTYVTQTIARVPNGSFMRALLQESQEERQKLVAGITKKPGLLPIDTTGMKKEEVQRLLDLWRSIVDGTGNLKLTSGFREGGFRKRMLAGIAQLLQTDVGRTLIDRLNQKQDDPSKNVTIGSGFSKELGTLGRPDPEDSQAVPRTPKDDNASMSFTVVPKSSLTGDEELEVFKGVESPASFVEFVSSLKPETTHFEYGGRTFQRGTGIGSHVKMAGAGKVHANLGTTMQEIVVPEFVTLGHELGHALRFLMGTTVPFGEDMSNFGFKGTQTQRTFWNNPEEYVNIMGVENVIRQEHGIATRQFHAGEWDATQAPLVNEELNRLFTDPVAKTLKTEHAAIDKIVMELAVLNVKKPRGQKDTLDKKSLKLVEQIEAQANEILLSSTTREAISTMQEAIAKTTSSGDGLSSPSDGSSDDAPVEKRTGATTDDGPTGEGEVSKGEVPTELSLPKLEIIKDLPPSSVSAPSIDEVDLPPRTVPVLGEGGGGTAYEILQEHSALSGEIPVGETVGVSGMREGSSKSSPKGTGVSVHGKLEREGYGATKVSLRDWLKRHHIRVIPNGGGGRNNCLVISLLQHASGSYGNPDDREVRQFKSLLTEDGIGEGESLLPTDPAFVKLIRAINKAYRRDLKVVYIQAFAGMDPPYALLESNVGSEPVVIWDKLGHYEALTT